MCSSVFLYVDPMAPLTTSRLLLRPLRLTDAEAIDKNIQSKAVLEHMLNMSYPYDTDRTIPFIREAMRDFTSGNQYVYAICDKHTHVFMGIIALSHIDYRTRSAEIYYWLGDTYWCRGYMSEAVSAVIGHSFHDLTLKHLFARVAAGNSGSIALLEKAGFRLQNVHKDGRYKNGNYEDEFMYCLNVLDIATRTPE